MDKNDGNRVSKKHQRQLNNEENNPCFKEQTMSLKCLDDNNYDRDMCSLQFKNYKNCNIFWDEVKRNRRSNGIKPILPSYDERLKIKEKYKETGKI